MIVVMQLQLGLQGPAVPRRLFRWLAEQAAVGEQDHPCGKTQLGVQIDFHPAQQGFTWRQLGAGLGVPSVRQLGTSRQGKQGVGFHVGVVSANQQAAKILAPDKCAGPTGHGGQGASLGRHRAGAIITETLPHHAAPWRM